jgi:hypothetical protein
MLPVLILSNSVFALRKSAHTEAKIRLKNLQTICFNNHFLGRNGLLVNGQLKKERDKKLKFNRELFLLYHSFE